MQKDRDDKKQDVRKPYTAPVIKRVEIDPVTELMQVTQGCFDSPPGCERQC
ncbi:MAG TPA: hypothetical protein VNA89_03530 [Gemmatimonadaceae bacterium]|nr:hypothetical protein [Gemmatimonadaceae bacterium]